MHRVSERAALISAGGGRHNRLAACNRQRAKLESQTPQPQPVAAAVWFSFSARRWPRRVLSMRSLLWRCLWCVFLVSCFAGCPASNSQPATGGGSGGTRRIMFVTNGDDPFWDALLSGLKEGSKQSKLAEAGLSAYRDVNNGSAEGQIEKLRQYATQDDIAGVAISVIQADNLAIIEEMRKLQKKGVKIITVDGDVNRNDFRDAR